MDINERIKTARENAHLTQTELAEKIGITRQLMCKYENGNVTNIPSDKIELLSDACHVSPAFIMGWEEVPANGQPQCYVDDEAIERIKAMQSNPQLATVFDATTKVKPEDLDQVLKLIKTYIGDN